jgi:hypothetical protein
MSASWKTWVGAGLVAPALALGCNSTGKHHTAGGCSTCGGGSVQYPPAHAVAMAPRPAEVNHEMTAPPVAPPKQSAAPRLIAERFPVSPPTKPATPVPAPAAPYVGAGYHHNAGYTSLVGELYYNPRQNTWRLRYAGVDEEDRYGGSVTLDSVGREMSLFKPGQYVRVDGALVNPQSREVSPAFRVRDILPAGQQ